MIGSDEIELNKLIIDKAKNLLLVVDSSDKEFVKSIINKSESKLINFNHNNLTIVNATKSEVGRWYGGLKRTIKARYFNEFLKHHEYIEPDEIDILCEKHKRMKQLAKYDSDVDPEIIKCKICVDNIKKYNLIWYKYQDFISHHSEIFDKAIDNTDFGDHLKNSFILATRKTKNIYRLTPLEKELRDYIKLKTVEIFTNNNQEIIKTYTL